MRKLFRPLALLLAGMLTVFMLTGCGGDDSDSEEKAVAACVCECESTGWFKDCR